MTDLSPDDPVLQKLHQAPHEPSALMRMHRAGHRSQDILEELSLRGTQLAKQMEQAKIEIDEAAGKGRPIHDALIPKEKS